MRVLSLCSGIGGLDLAARMVDPDARTVAYCEVEPFARRVLERRMATGDLDDAPILGDLRHVDWSEWRGRADALVAGFPCQPHSRAGKRRHLNDERWIWPDIACAVKESGVGTVFFENVPGLFDGGGLDAVVQSLAALGFALSWATLRASSIGAPHRRERLFILGVADSVRAGREGARKARRLPAEGRERVADAGSDGDQRRRGRGEAAPSIRGDGRRWVAPARDAAHDRRTDLADADSAGLGLRADRNAPRGHDVDGCNRACCALGNADQFDGDARGGQEGSIGAGRAVARRAGRAGRAWPRPWPPGPGDRDAWRAILDADPSLAPATALAPLRRVADGLPAGLDMRAAGRLRRQRLKALGNAVVPLQAAWAWAMLRARLTQRRLIESDHR